MKKLLPATLFCVATLVAGRFTVTIPNAEALPSRQFCANQHNVLDFYYLLPYVGNTPKTKSQRRELLNHKNKHILDFKNDYIEVNPDSFPTQQLAVFRYRGTELVATSTPDSHSDYNNFYLYRLREGKLHEVTDKELGFPARTGAYLYELPRYGTTIPVYLFSLEKQSRRHVFDLKWEKGRFTRVNRS